MMRAIAVALLTSILAGTCASAQEAPPLTSPTVLPTAVCAGTPRTSDEVEAILAATPSDWSDARFVDHEADLPKGAPADPDVVDAITAVAATFVACLNAADWPRWAGLMSENAIRQALGNGDLDEIFLTTGTPFADELGIVQITLVAVRDVRVLPDGRVGAVVEWGRVGSSSGTVDEANFHIFVEEDGEWQLDEEISGFGPWYQQGEPEPDWSTAATPVAWVR